MREAKDRGAQWMIEHHGDSIVRLAGVAGFTAWRAVRSVLTHPKLLPDGVLELTFPGEPEPTPFLVEITTYPDGEEREQVLRDAALVLLERGVVPDIVSLVLAPKGNLRLSGNYERTSKRGLTRLGCQWHVIDLWTVPAADLLAFGDVGVLPWLPLTRYDGPPEALLQECRERIEQQAPPAEQDNLLAVAATMASFVYNDRRLLSLLLRRPAVQMSPLMKEIVTEAECRATQRAIVSALKTRFGTVPDDLAAQIRTIQDEGRLESLLPQAIVCPSVEVFRELLA